MGPSRSSHRGGFPGARCEDSGPLPERAGRVHRSIVVFLGPRRQQLEDIEVLPVMDFLGELPR